MLYYLALYLIPHMGVFNVLTYHTVRAGGAALTGFIICLIVGPSLIDWLHRVKVGQYIKKEHVADLHALHKGKAGTPTMGGALIVLSAVLSLLLWGRLANRLLWVAIAVFCLMGAVGFLDDFIKLRRKHNSGLSARAKLAGQILTGFLLGLYLVVYPVTFGAARLSAPDVVNWTGLVARLRAQETADTPTAAKPIWDALDDRLKERLLAVSLETTVDERTKTRLLEALNDMLESAAFPGRDEIEKRLEDDPELERLSGKGSEALTDRQRMRLNRLLLEAALPESIRTSTRNLHTHVEIPGFKDRLIPLGPFYILFVILVITATSNAVNLTDGLDGLAAGSAVISLLAYTGIAYVISRADWSSYLYLIHVPEASELTVFGAAILGTGLGFLWFNCHPAEVFMGDTGSLALGGVLGTMAVLTKQELLLPVVAGLFVIEALSVVVQVASFKLTGRRVLRMAPLHHHFELLGWTETKVTIRFWIIAVLFALMSLGTLKLR